MRNTALAMRNTPVGTKRFPSTWLKLMLRTLKVLALLNGFLMGACIMLSGCA